MTIYILHSKFWDHRQDTPEGQILWYDKPNISDWQKATKYQLKDTIIR